MVAVFITNIQNKVQATGILNILGDSFPGLNINFDLEGHSGAPFPCGHNILRVAGVSVNSKNIIATVNKHGFMCDVLADKVCK